MNSKTKTRAGTKACIAAVSLLLSCTVSHAAFADGMPFGYSAPPTSSNVIPDTPDNTDTVNTTGTASSTQMGDANTAQPTAESLPKPLPPVPADSVIHVRPNSSFFGLSVGEYDPFRHSDHATSFNAELQPGIKVLGVLQPLFGAMATTKGSAMAYAGVGVPFHITHHIFLMPSAALGLYRAGGGYDLGRTVVERFGAELAYQFNDKSRLGLNFDVITNGKSLHARDRTEMLALTYTRPFNLFSGASAQASSPAENTVAPAPAAAPVSSVKATTIAPAPAASTSTMTIAPASDTSTTTTIAPAPAASTSTTPTIAPATSTSAPTTTTTTSPTASPTTTAFPSTTTSPTLTPAEENTHAFP